MKIAIIGAGSVGQALASGWSKAGHKIFFGVRNPQEEKARALQTSGKGTAVTNADAVREAEVVVLSTPWKATEAAIRACGELKGKVVIDCTNPLTEKLELERGFTTSGGEQVAQWAKGAQVFKAMNQVGYALMDNPKFSSGVKPVMFVAGEGSGKCTVLTLVSELGFEPIDAGDLKVARLLEPYALLWIHLAISRGLGRDFAFGLLRR